MEHIHTTARRDTDGRPPPPFVDRRSPRFQPAMLSSRSLLLLQVAGLHEGTPTMLGGGRCHIAFQILYSLLLIN
jgi:hypothetical protein